MKKYFITTVSLLFIVWAVGTFGASANTLKPETRGFWVVRGDDLLSEERIDKFIQIHAELNFNAIFVQVNGRFNSFYPSKLVPSVNGVTENFDPLQIIIDKAKENGMEVHAWINAYTAWPLGETPEFPNHVVNQHPEWMTIDNEGVSVLDYASDKAVADMLPTLFLEPGVPEVQDFVTAMFMEVVKNYDIDGIHFDYIRYPARIFGFHEVNVDRFEAKYGVNPFDIANNAQKLMEELGRERFWELSFQWDQLRRDNVTTLVRRIYNEVKSVKPDVMVSAAVFADLASGSATEHRFQDWPSWLEEGIIDAVLPMAYGTNPAVVAYQIQQAVKHAGEKGMAFAGLGAYNIPDGNHMAQMIQRVRSVNPHGIVLFAYNTIADNEEYKKILRNHVFPESVPTYKK